MDAILPEHDGFYHPRNEQEIQGLVCRARRERIKIRVRGAAHSVHGAIFTGPLDRNDPPADGINIMLDQLGEVDFNDQLHQVTAQAGCHLGEDPKDPTKEPRQRLNAEFSNRKHRKGTLSMARQNDPNSATCQFFFCFAATAHLDGKYTIFGQITEGEDVLDAIEKVETDHNPCKGCKAELPPGPTQHCGRPGHHTDKPTKEVILKKVTLKVRKRK